MRTQIFQERNDLITLLMASYLILSHAFMLVVLVRIAVSGNRAFFGGGIYNDGMLTMKNTVIANSSSGGNCSGVVATSDEHNLSDDGSCYFAGTGDLNNTDREK